MKKRGREINIKINLTNRWLYTLIAIGILAIIGVGVYALTPGVAPNPGHSANDMAPPSPCAANQFLKFDGTNWVCSKITSSSMDEDTISWNILNKSLYSPTGMWNFAYIRIANPWIIPKGIYMMASNTVDADKYMILQVQVSPGNWMGEFGPEGVVVSDGVNVRIYNSHPSYAGQAWYRKLD